MAWALFLGIAGIWAVFLLPPLWADRRPSSVSAARRRAGLDEPGEATATARTTYQSPGHPAGRAPEGLDRSAILLRRRRVLLALAGAAFVSLVGAVMVGGPWLVGLHGAVDALLVAYVVMLRRIAQARRSSAPFEAEYEYEMSDVSRVRVVQSS